jgi:hypothetical protein
VTGGSSFALVVRGLPREVGGLLRRHPVRAGAPAALLGAGAAGILLLRHHIRAEIALGLLVGLLFEFYIGYAESLVAADRRPERIHKATLLRRATAVTPRLLVASLAAVTLPVAATGLLVLPGLWLLTRWSLFAPVIVHEHLGARASLARSTELVRGAFWAVACTVTISVLLEHGAIHGSVHIAPGHGSLPLSLAGAALVTMLVSPPAAFTISVVYERLAGVHPGVGARLHPDTGAPPSRTPTEAAG